MIVSLNGSARSNQTSKRATKVIDYYRGKNPELTILLILFLMRS